MEEDVKNSLDGQEDKCIDLRTSQATHLPGGTDLQTEVKVLRPCNEGRRSRKTHNAGKNKWKKRKRKAKDEMVGGRDESHRKALENAKRTGSGSCQMERLCP